MQRPFHVLGIQLIAIGGLDKKRLQKLWVDEGNDLGMYSTGASKGRLNVEAGKVYSIDITLAEAVAVLAAA